MSLEEFPLYLILIPSVEVGLDGDDGLGILFPIRGCSALDVHDEWSTGVKVVEEGRAGEPRGKRGWFIGSLYLQCRTIHCQNLRLFPSSEKWLIR